MDKIGFGGSCHWCTEAVFQSLKGVAEVDQGWIATDSNDFSEAVIVHFDAHLISLETLVTVHLHTHSSTAVHRMRSKYKSAIYTFTAEQSIAAQKAISKTQPEFPQYIITEVLPFGRFKFNSENYLNYYYNNPGRPFCENVISPKLQILLKKFSKEVNHTKLAL